jgi:hypothetical protein
MFPFSRLSLILESFQSEERVPSDQPNRVRAGAVRTASEGLGRTTMRSSPIVDT